MPFSPGINVLIGANGTGKTHIMKICYAACDITKTGRSFTDKLVHIFLPSNYMLWRLGNRRARRAEISAKVSRPDLFISASFPNPFRGDRSSSISNSEGWRNTPIESVYIPVKEMLSNAPGFQSIYEEREIHFEEVYNDILRRAYRPFPRQKLDQARQGLLRKLQDVIGGSIRRDNQEFFLSSRSGPGRLAGRLEFTLLAEGIRKLGLLWLLIRNGSLPGGAALFWDEPETNLNPSLFGVVVDVLLELQRLGVQIFLATHSYVLLKEIDLRKKDTDQVVFHALYRTENGDIAYNSTEDYFSIDPNLIAEVFESLYDREVERTTEALQG